MEDSSGSPRIVRQWLIGIVGSWACIWLLGPWLVNSILVRVHDPAMNVITLREGDLIRWRSEGWANTLVGPHGRPGWKPNQASSCIVIWGDSQVEGFCVDDPDKICNQIVRIAQAKQRQSIDCIPLGRSGTDATDWSRLTGPADALWKPFAHVWIITELADLIAFADRTDRTSDAGSRWQAESPMPVLVAKATHADAAFQAARNLVLDPTTGTRRSLRWTIGPVNDAIDSGSPSMSLHDETKVFQTVQEQLKQLDQRIDERLILVYAPSVPRIMGGIVEDHPDDAAWESFASLIAGTTIMAIDMRGTFIDRWASDEKLARGFHNGTPSFGHLNAFGNQLIAEAIVDQLAVIARQDRSTSAGTP